MQRMLVRAMCVVLLLVVAPLVARAQAVADSMPALTPAGAVPVDDAPAGSARTFDADAPWFVEASIGAALPGLTGTDFGSGQHYAIHFGAQTRESADLALGLGWVSARNTDEAIDSDITDGELRGRMWVRGGRWLGYGAVGLALYRFSVKQQSVLVSTEDDRLRFGGLLGAGVQYVRTKFWAGLGVQALGAFGESDLSTGNLLTVTTIDLSFGVPIGR